MRKISLVLALILTAALFCGCLSGDSKAPTITASGLSIEYDEANNLSVVSATLIVKNNNQDDLLFDYGVYIGVKGESECRYQSYSYDSFLYAGKSVSIPFRTEITGKVISVDPIISQFTLYGY